MYIHILYRYMKPSGIDSVRRPSKDYDSLLGLVRQPGCTQGDPRGFPICAGLTCTS